jgi:hypothetical protein
MLMNKRIGLRPVTTIQQSQFRNVLVKRFLKELDRILCRNIWFLRHELPLPRLPLDHFVERAASAFVGRPLFRWVTKRDCQKQARILRQAQHFARGCFLVQCGNARPDT